MFCSPLYFFLVTAQLPLPLLPFQGSAPLTGELACLTPACWSTPGVGLEGSGCVLFLRACSVRCFPSCRFPYGFQSPGVCTSASLVTWVGLQPFPSFSGLLLLCLLAGVVGVLHPVSGCSSWGVVCLVCRWGHPAAFSLTLDWVCFWPKVSRVFVGCEGGLGCPSWFFILFLCLLVLHLFWGWGGFGQRLVAPPATPDFGLFWCSVAPSWRLSLWLYSHLWPLDGPGTCSCLGFTLGSSLSLPVLAAGLRWLRFILSCPPSVASLRW